MMPGTRIAAASTIARLTPLLPRKQIPAGRHWVTDRGMILSTSLTSSVCVCLDDVVNRVYGMSQFALPETPQVINPIGLNERLGAHALELLVNDMLAQGAERPFLAARIYGGAQFVAAGADIGLLNMAFVVEYLQKEAIPIRLADSGDGRPRRVDWRVPLHEPTAAWLEVSEAAATHGSVVTGGVTRAPAVRATLFSTVSAEAYYP